MGSEHDQQAAERSRKLAENLEAVHPTLPPPPPPTRPEPAVFPGGFWPRLDYLMQHRDNLLESIRLDVNLGAISGVLVLIAIIMGGLYGGLMGATNLFQGSPMSMGAKLALIGITAVKVPLLFLLTLLIVLPPIYVSNAFAGARLSFRQVLCVLVGATALGTTILASMGTVAAFFALTSRSYDFIKLLHVVFFAYSGFMGIGFLVKAVEYAGSGSLERRTPTRLRLLWLVLYMFVGMQLAWVLRPFVGSPGEPFQVFRKREGSFVESVTHSLGNVLQGRKSHARN